MHFERAVLRSRRVLRLPVKILAATQRCSLNLVVSVVLASASVHDVTILSTHAESHGPQ
jgi:hypothetical protein